LKSTPIVVPGNSSGSILARRTALETGSMPPNSPGAAIQGQIAEAFADWIDGL
jgi:hypothetical protein